MGLALGLLAVMAGLLWRRRRCGRDWPSAADR